MIKTRYVKPRDAYATLKEFAPKLSHDRLFTLAGMTMRRAHTNKHYSIHKDDEYEIVVRRRKLSEPLKITVYTDGDKWL